MTLQDLQNRIKILVVFVALGVYGLGFFALGKFTNINDLLKVKGEATSQTQDDKLEKPQPYADVQTQAVNSSFIKLCSNTSLGFEVSYPNDWFTTYNSESEKCTFFAPYSFVIPTNIEKDFVPITIQTVLPEEWESTVTFAENPNDFQNVTSAKNLEINGRPVKKVESMSTGSGLLQRGLVKVSYLVFSSVHPTVITYQQLDAGDDIAEFDKTLDEMVASLKILE